MPKDHPRQDWFRRFRQSAFISGGISIASWYFAFALAVSRFQGLTLWHYLGTYLLLLILAFGGALLADWMIRHQANQSRTR